MGDSNINFLVDFKNKATILLWYKDPARFFKDIFGSYPYKYQEQVLKELSDIKIKRILITASAGSGKTKLVACHALWLTVPFSIIENRPVTIVIISGSQNQARTLYGYIKEAIQNNDLIKDFVEGEITQNATKFKNGSSISAVPNSHKAIQSLHKDVAIVDEPCVLPESVIFSKYSGDSIIRLENNDPTTYSEKNVVTQLYAKEVNEQLINIQPYYSCKIEITRHHPISIVTESKFKSGDFTPCWVESKDIKAKDWLAYDLPSYDIRCDKPKRFFAGLEMPYDLFWLLGKAMTPDVVLGDYKAGEIIIKAKDGLRKIRNLLDNLLGINYKISNNGITMYNIDLYRFIKSNFYEFNGKSKSIPSWLFHYDNQAVYYFLEGMSSGYGGKIITESKKTYAQVVNLILKLKRIPMITAKKTKYGLRYEIKISQDDLPHAKLIGDKLYVQVKNVYQKLYTGMVYNLEVLPDNYYLSYPFKLHNCIAGDFVIDDTKRIVVKDNSLDRIILLGTPFVPPESKAKSTKFIDMWVDKEKYPEWRRYHWSAMDCPTITAEQIEEAKRTLSEEMFSIFWMGEPYFIGESLIPIDQLREASMDVKTQYDPSFPVVAGVDWGYKHETVLTLAQKRNDVWYVILSEGWNNIEYQELNEMIYSICREYNVETIYADAEAIGENQRLQSRGLNVIPIPFVRYRTQLQANLQTLFAKRRIKIDESMMKLKEQLRKYNWDTKKNDDRVDSLMLAVNNIFDDDEYVPYFKVL